MQSFLAVVVCCCCSVTVTVLFYVTGFPKSLAQHRHYLWLIQNAISLLPSVTSWVVLSDVFPAVEFCNVLVLVSVRVVWAVQEREIQVSIYLLF